MTARRGRRPPLVAVDGALLGELVGVLGRALVEGKRRPLGRLAAREGLAADEALAELAAFPAGACPAADPAVGLALARCRAGAGCPVEDECALVAGGRGPAGSRTAALVRGMVEGWILELPAAPVAVLADLLDPLRALLERSGRVGPDAPPRARTSIALVEMAVSRGGIAAATGPFLLATEAEQVAAHVPPGAGRGDRELAPVEAWLRHVASREAALVELP